MSDDTSFEGFTGWLNRVVKLLQTGVALFLVIVLIIGLINLVATFVRAALAIELLGYKQTIGLISTTIDIVLYLFIVIELYRTIIAYVASKNVVQAVVHAGLIAVVRQIITFKPADIGNTQDALLTAGIYFLLLIGLLSGFFLVHRMESEIGDDENLR